MAKECPIELLAPSGKDSIDGYRKSKMNPSQLNHQQDFTTVQYAELLRLAKANYKFIGYQEIVTAEKFVLWRHDCDYSLNRSLRLAQIEHQESLKATYFLNPHCEFYNLLEKGQAQIVKEVLALGHDIGLHFDAAYYDIESEDQLDALVEREASWIADWFGVKPVAFSFHNPTKFLLSCDQDNYGELPNCYSKAFKSTIPYCSDSNGYWRFRRLWDVLESAQDSCLQVLTHPGWWQEVVQHPRERIFRSVYGRATAIMHLYDTSLETHGRENLAGPAGNLKFLKEISVDQYQLCDYLWNGRMLQGLFIELYRLHERQLKQLCKAMFHGKWHVSSGEVEAIFEIDARLTDGWRLFSLVFGATPAEASGSSEDVHTEWVTVLNQLLLGESDISDGKLEEGFIYLCGAMEGLAKWGRAKESIGYDGISSVRKIGIPTDLPVRSERGRLDNLEDNAGLPDNAWKEFLMRAKSAIAEQD